MRKVLSLMIGSVFVNMLLITSSISAVMTINDEKILKENLSGPTWEWAKSGGGSSLDYGKDITVDDNGNIYVIGKYFDMATFGTTTLKSYGPIKSWDIFVAKLDKNGNWLWSVGAGGMYGDEGAGISLDDDGNIYITGTFYDTAWFGEISLSAYGYQDIFIAKLDNDGNWLWAIKAGGHAGESAYGIAVDGGGNIYVTGHFMFLATFGTVNLNSLGGADVFVIKLDTDGNWLWAIRGGGTLSDFVCDIALDKNGNAFLTGDFEGSATFGTDTITSLGDVDVFIAKVDTNGNWLWARSGGSSSIETGYDIDVDDIGNAYVIGVFFVSITFGSTMLQTQGEFDVYVLKIDTNGDFIWAVRGGGSFTEGGWGIAVDDSGNSYVTGVFSDSSIFGTTKLVSQGIRDVFVAKLNMDGDWIWAKSAGGANWDEGYDIAVDKNGYVYTTGYYEISATFDATALTGEGEYDVFIAKLNQPPNAPIINGPKNIRLNIKYKWTFVSSDQNGDDITYFVDWGDGSGDPKQYGPYPSGEKVTLSHTYTSKNSVIINAKAVDEYGADSDCTYLEVTVSKNKEAKTISLKFLESHPNLFLILQKLIQRFGL